MERGSRKWKGKNAETKDEMFWAVGNRLLGSFLGRARTSMPLFSVGYGDGAIVLDA
jgi:hypothetical protein